jgi:hypothetical protein
MIGAETPIHDSIFNRLYNIIWTVIIAQAVLGFIIVAFFQEYNPVQTARLYAKHQKKHTLIIGYNHLSARIVVYLRKNHRPFVIIEDNDKAIDELIHEEEAIVIGDPMDDKNLNDAQVKKCKEAFILTDKSRTTIICAEKIRAANPTCKLYLKLFEKEFNSYLNAPPFNALTFSNSKWALKSVGEWVKDETGTTLVLGSNHLSRRVTEYLAYDLHRSVIMMDSKIDTDMYRDNPKVKVIKDDVNRVDCLEEHINFNEINQIFFCWNENESTADSLYISMELKRRFPTLKIYVRIFQDELGLILEKVGIIPFSITKSGFKMLQKEVHPTSAIYEK